MELSSPSAVQWSDLPDELLGLVRSKVASLRGRVLFAAICRSWRAAVWLHPAPPALPLLLLSPRDWRTTEERSRRLYCPEDDSILRVPLPSRLNSALWINGSYDGGWIATTTSPTPSVSLSPIMIMNPFSGAEVTLSKKQTTISCPRNEGCPFIIWKIIFSEAPTSSSCILAAMASGGCKIALCRIGCPDGGWTLEGYDMERLEDIIFFRGDLYGLTRFSESLFRFDIGVNDDGAPVVIATHRLDVQMCDRPMTKSFHNYSAYIFELRGKIAMAVNAIWTQNGRRSFRVYELAGDDCTHIYKWSELHNLGDYALFLGSRSSSKAVHVPTCGGVEKNHIYYSNNRCLSAKQEKEFRGESYLTRPVDGDTMYVREDRSVVTDDGDMVRIPSVGYYSLGSLVPMWCFPPDM
ncbi:hypothetical protein ACQ4PT_050155 [Festuca glaucescens]